MPRRQVRIKENWQDADDGKKNANGRTIYGQQKTPVFPLTLADELKRAAKAEGVSENYYIIEAVAEKLGIDLDD